MKAIYITHAGGPEVLQYKDHELPQLQQHEVQIAVRAAGVNRSDILTRNNPDAYGRDAPKAQIPGLEVAGEVLAVGASVKKFKKGDNLIFASFGGGFTWGATYLKWAYNS